MSARIPTEPHIFVDGVWGAAATAATIDLINPSDGTVLTRIARGQAADVDRAVDAARRSLSGPWGALSAAERGRILSRMAVIVRERADDLAHIEALDVGKPLKQSRADALALARYLEFYGGAADKVMGETIPYQPGTTALTIREPHGVTAHVIPWNYPMQIIGRSVGAALAMGNAAVLKPAEEACLTALEFARIAEAAGLPAGALNVVTGLGEEAGAALVGHRGVDHVSFTGSVATGVIVQTLAARNAVPVTLELGGKSPQIVFADADVDAALPFLVMAGLQNAGQTCSAASRILIHRSRFDEVAARMAERYRALSVGPALADLDVGPLVSARQKEIVEGFIVFGIDSGLPVVARATVPAGLGDSGAYVMPTLFGPVAPNHRLAQEEIFGPVQVLIPFETEKEAVEIANGTDFGLVAGVWTADVGCAFRMARALRTGQVFINNYGAGGGIELPFGGVKRSGHGREKGFEALYGFSILKTVTVLHG